MPSGFFNRSLAKAAERVPGLNRVPLFRLLAAADVAVAARDHLQKLTPDERRRLLSLIATGRGRPSQLTASDHAELEALLAKLEARRFVGDAVSAVSPVPLPRRLVYGKQPSMPVDADAGKVSRADGEKPPPGPDAA